jgi:hypothetical protein
MERDEKSGDDAHGADGRNARIVVTPEEARQAEIVLRSRQRRWLFLGVLGVLIVGIFVVGVVSF